MTADQLTTIVNLASDMYVSDKQAETRNIIMNSALKLMFKNHHIQLVNVLGAAVLYLVQD